MADQYGFWTLVVADVLLVGWGATALFHPRSRHDWKALGGLWAFIVALFTEMYGFPLTLYLLEGPLGSTFPQLRPTFAGGHLWGDLVGWGGDPELSPFVLGSYPVILGGFWLVGAGWSALWHAAREDRLATAGYAAVRHPQYVGFGPIMGGFLLQWPTILTAAMAPLMAWLYRRLARREEVHQRRQFGQDWEEYASAVPPWVPHVRPLLRHRPIWLRAWAASHLQTDAERPSSDHPNDNNP